MQLSIIIPAKNEAASIGGVVGKIRSDFSKAEVIAVERMGFAFASNLAELKNISSVET